jgi:lipoprotein-anchoring transpeptidase ErfK/SrfK
MQNKAIRQQNTGRRPVRQRLFKVVLSLVILFGLAGATTYAIKSRDAAKPATQVVQETKPAAKSKQPTKPMPAAPTPAPAPTTTAKTAASMCAGNTLSQLALVSISQRHMWACEGATPVYESAVVTGMENLAADLTPVGTYHIYAKQTNLYLKGSDSTGSWNDYVNYWMPWLNNQYGQYGFHDATWRSDSAFGNIDPASSDASHGCVELPLATAKWLYNWAQIGTTVTVVS